MKAFLSGCGSIGRRHARNLVREFNLELVLFDPDPDRLGPLAGSLPAEGVDSFEEGLRTDPDLAFICSPTHLHVSQATRALEAGCHLFVEKPLSHDLEEARKFVGRTRSASRKILVGCNMRFHPPVVRIRDWIDDGRIGTPYFGRFSYGNYLPRWRPDQDYRDAYSSSDERGGGILLEGVHDLDCARWLIGEPGSVHALALRCSDLELETEDTAEVLFRVGTDRMAQVHLDYLRSPRQRCYEVTGSEGTLQWRGTGKNPERDELILTRHEEDDGEREVFETDLNQMYVHQVRHFLDVLRTDGEPAVGPRGALRVLELALSARESASSESTVSTDSSPSHPEG